MDGPAVIAQRPPAPEATAAILVGGLGRRMGGRVKAHLRVGAHAILDAQIAAVSDAGLGQPLFVGAWPHGEQFARRSMPDLVENGGALGGLYSALLLAPTAVVVVLASDMPFVTGDLLRRLAEIGEDSDAVVPRTAEGWHPLCAGYRRRVAWRIKARLDRYALRVSDALTDVHVTELGVEALARLDPTGRLLTNVNTLDDLHTAARHARRD